MPTFLFKKLVRDNIWSWHEEAGHTVDGTKLKRSELSKALREKLFEEVDEVQTAQTSNELIEEIADVRQLLDDICAHEGIDTQLVEAAQAAKRSRKGGFLKGMYIDTVYMPEDDDKWVEYCRKTPEKYPELQKDNAVDERLIGKYEHSKTKKLYEILGTALHTETNELMVVYKPLYDSKHEYFVRPYSMFTELVIVNEVPVRRFVKIAN